MSERLNWRAAIWAGFVAGIVFIMLEMALVSTVGGMSPWAPPRMMAAIAMGERVLPPPATFDAVVVGVAMAVHFTLSIILGVILGWAISRWRMGLLAALLVGTIFGLTVYLVDFYIFTAIFPWFAMARNAISIFAHAVFGLVLGGVYRTVARRGVRDSEHGPRTV